MNHLWFAVVVIPPQALPPSPSNPFPALESPLPPFRTHLISSPQLGAHDKCSNTGKTGRCHFLAYRQPLDHSFSSDNNATCPSPPQEHVEFSSRGLCRQASTTRCLDTQPITPFQLCNLNAQDLGLLRPCSSSVCGGRGSGCLCDGDQVDELQRANCILTFGFDLEQWTIEFWIAVSNYWQIIGARELSRISLLEGVVTCRCILWWLMMKWRCWCDSN